MSVYEYNWFMSAATVFDTDPDTGTDIGPVFGRDCGSGPGVLGGLLVRGHGLADELFGVLDAHGADAGVGALGELDRLIERLRAVRLRVIALSEAAGEVRRAGHASTGSWVARQTNTNPFAGARDANLAAALGMDTPADSPPVVASAARGRRPQPGVRQSRVRRPGTRQSGVRRPGTRQSRVRRAGRSWPGRGLGC